MHECVFGGNKSFRKTFYKTHCSVFGQEPEIVLTETCGFQKQNGHIRCIFAFILKHLNT